ncbi:alpha-L-fucosidase [Segatella baroniae F0067]|uniref:alpha-L-fucosidase n=2 Tax=Segatella baroniae TaxID=305719 RepID=U2NKN0_9BACT|nr:alpha-L-fucosidase [Segatella baroniae F0067]
MKKILISLLALTMALPSMGQGDVYEKSKTYEWPTDPQVVDKLKNWQDLKFGVLMHWGVYSVPGMVESWAICDEDWVTRDTTMTYQQYKEWYWGLADKFNPVKFNPDQWASVMRDAGMRYMIFTTKHHDGFCLFDSKYTDYTIARHAFRDNPKRDVLKHVLQSFRDKGFMIGEYFSKPDWHSQDYWWDVYPTKRGRNVNYDIKKWPWRWEAFKKYTYDQMEEVLTRYGKVDIFWLDGGWVCKENNQDIDLPKIATMARSHQPGLIIVDRTIHGPYENYRTPERTIPETQLDTPWESCIPLTNDWGWVPRPTWKSPAKVINTLIEVVAKGGNLVLGVGPTPEGLIEPEAVQRLEAIGRWLNKNGQALYNTTITPHYNEGRLWFTASKDGKKCYALYALPDGEQLPATLSWTGNKPKSVRLLATGRKLKAQKQGNRTTVSLPKGLKNEPIALELSL